MVIYGLENDPTAKIVPLLLGVVSSKAANAPPSPMIGTHYFGGWYNCSGSPPNSCYSHFQGYAPTGAPVTNFFPSYPSRTPLLGMYTTDVATVTAEVHAADSALDFWSMLYYDKNGGMSCGSHPYDSNLAPCLDASLGK